MNILHTEDEEQYFNVFPVSSPSVRNFPTTNIFNIENPDFFWCTDYADDINELLKEIEKKRSKIHFKSPQKQFRWTLVQLIKSTAETLVLRRATVHLAVYLLDCFMDHYKIAEYKLKAIALMCLLLSCKIEESEYKIPSLQYLCSVVDEDYKKPELKTIEIKLLIFFKWYLLFPTGATFLESYVTKVINIEEFQIYKHQNQMKQFNLREFNEMATNMHLLVFDLLDLTLQECRFGQLLPSLLSAACLAAARKTIGVYPIWNEHLIEITGYNFVQIQEIVKALISLKLINDEQKSTPDSGFLSEDSDSDDSFSISCPIPFKIKR